MKLSEMTAEAKRVAIARACGWRIGTKRFKRTDGWHVGKRWEHKTAVCGQGGGAYGFDYNSEAAIRTLPNYTESVEDMLSAVASLNNRDRHAYAVVLAEFFYPLGWADWRDTLAVSEASSENRADAFLISKGLATP